MMHQYVSSLDNGISRPQTLKRPAAAFRTRWRLYATIALLFVHSIAAVAAPRAQCAAASEIGNASIHRPQSNLAQQPDAGTPKLSIIHRLAHATEVEAVAWSPDGKLLATTSGFFRQVTLWDALTGKATKEFTLAAAFGQSLAFTADSQYLITSPAHQPTDTTRTALTIWDVKSGAIVRDVDGPYPTEDAVANKARVFVFDPPKNRLAVIAQKGPGRVVAIYDAQTWSIDHKFAIDRDTPYALAFSTSGILAVGTISGHIALIDLDRGTTLRTFQAYGSSQGGVDSLAFSPDGSLLASGPTNPTTMIMGADGQPKPTFPEDPVRIWDTDHGTLACSFTGKFGDVLGLAWSADGRLLASASAAAALRLWPKGTPTGAEVVANFSGYGWAVAFSSDSKRLAIALGTSVIVAEIIR